MMINNIGCKKSGDKDMSKLKVSGYYIMLILIMLHSNVLHVRSGSASLPSTIFNKILDIQGVKYISEGGYFFIQITNKSPQNITIKFEVDLYRETAGFRWFESDNYLSEEHNLPTGSGGLPSSHYIYIYDNILIPANTSLRWHFIAPTVKESAGYSEINYQIILKSDKWWGTLYSGWITIGIINIKFLQVNLNTFHSIKSFTLLPQEINVKTILDGVSIFLIIAFVLQRVWCLFKKYRSQIT